MRHAGIMRGFLHRQGGSLIDYVAANLYEAAKAWHQLDKKVQDDSVSGLHDRDSPFGTGYTVLTDSTLVQPVWRPDTMLALHSQLAHNSEKRRVEKRVWLFWLQIQGETMHPESRVAMARRPAWLQYLHILP